MAINPLQPSEIEAWCRLMDIQPTPWEVRTLLRMDAAFLARLSKPKPSQKMGQTVDVNDVEGVRALLSSFKRHKPRQRGGLKKIEVAKDT